MNQLTFGRQIHDVLAQADENCLLINCGWTVLIPKADAVEYVEKYNNSPDRGFFEHAGKVILTHKSGKITFEQNECDAIVSLIKAAYIDVN